MRQHAATFERSFHSCLYIWAPILLLQFRSPILVLYIRNSSCLVDSPSLSDYAIVPGLSWGRIVGRLVSACLPIVAVVRVAVVVARVVVVVVLPAGVVWLCVVVV